MLLLTGATGSLGRKLLPHLDANEPILLLSRSAQPKLQKLFPHIRIVQGDLQDPSTLRDQFADVTSVIHLAARTHARSWRAYARANSDGTKHLLAALPAKLDAFVYASTTCALPDSGWYGESKLVAEKMILAKYPHASILRIADVYAGAGEKSLEQLIGKAARGGVVPVIGDGNQLLAPVHVDDVVAALHAAQRGALQGTWVIAGPEQMTLLELFTRISQHTHRSVRPLHLPVGVFNLLVQCIGRLPNAPVYPDQVRRFVVKKDLDAAPTWQHLRHQPVRFSPWLVDRLRQKTTPATQSTPS